MPAPIDLGEFVAGYLTRVVNQRDLSAVDDMIAADYTGGGHGWPESLAELRAFYEWQATSRPGWHIEVQETVAVGDCVVVRAEASGTVTEFERGRPLAAPTVSHVEWLAAYWVSYPKIKRIEVLSLTPRADR